MIYIWRRWFETQAQGGSLLCFTCRFAENDPQKAWSGLNKSREVYFYGEKDFIKKYFLEIFFLSILEIARWQKSGIQKGSNGERVQKCKILRLFFYNTLFINYIFSVVALIARCSKYDFWIHDQVLALETKIQIKNKKFRSRKCWSKKMVPKKT